MNSFNRYKLYGTITAGILLVASLLIRKFADESMKDAASGVLVVGVWALVAFDTLAYQEADCNEIQKRIEKAKLVAYYLIASFLTVAIVIYIMAGKG